MKKLYIFETNGGSGPAVHVEALNNIEAYTKARETLASMNMPFELELIEIRYLNKGSNYESEEQ